jgi:hypothetical protein
MMRTSVQTLYRLACWQARRSFFRSAQRAAQVNEATLCDILRLNRDTEIGKRLGFARLLKARDVERAYRAAVPLSVYDECAEAIERQTAHSQPVLTQSPLSAVVGSAGTSGAAKRLLLTHRGRRKTVQLIVLVSQGVLNQALPLSLIGRRGINLLGSANPDLPPTASENLSGPPSVVSSPADGMRHIRRLVPMLWTSPMEVCQVQHQPSLWYLHALFGLAERDALFIATPFSSQLLAWLGLLIRHSDRLVRDLRDGTLSNHLQLVECQRARLLRLLSAQPARAEEVARAFTGDSAGLAMRLWPRMRYVQTVSSGTFALARDRLRAILGPTILLHSVAYGSSEGMIGVSVHPGELDDYVLACGQCFFEFIPSAAMAERQPTTVDAKQLRIGEQYEVVLSSYSGLYRYRLGDVIRVVGAIGEAPVFNVLYRRGSIVNLDGEQMTELQTSESVRRALIDILGNASALTDFSVVAGHSEHGLGQYTFYIELAADTRWPSTIEFASRLDKHLADINVYYAQRRREERMASAVVCALRATAFEEILEKRRAEVPTIHPTLKVPHFATSEAQRKLLEAFSQ